jgi:hypothetical protein
MSEFEFGSVDLGEVTSENARLSEGNNQTGFLDQFVPMPEVKPGQTGSISLRILPPAKGQKLYVATRIHTINGRKIHCPRPLVNGKWDKNVYCPICEYYNSLWRKVDKLEDEGKKDEAEAVKKEARDIKPVERYYYNAIVRKLTNSDGETQTNVGPRIFSVGKTLHQMVLRAICGDGTEPALGDITAIKNGYDFILKKEIRVTGDQEFPNYDRSTFAREPSVAGTQEEVKNWADNLHDLGKLRTLKDGDALDKELAIHCGFIPDDNETFDVDEFARKYRNDEVSTVITEAPAAVAVAAPVVETPVEEMDLSVESDDLMRELADMG